MAGPVPKRSETRRRRNKPEGAQLVKAAAGAPVVWPTPDRGWHPAAKEWFESLQVSGQARFYERSDTAVAYVVAQMMSTLLETGRPSAQMFAAVMSAQADLLTTEGARRRARVELERAAGEADPDEVAAVADFADYQRKLGG